MNNCNNKNQSAEKFFNDVLGTFEGIFGKDMNPITGFEPLTNVLEDEESFKLELAVPGRSKSDFKISLEKNTLTIQTKDDVENPKDIEGEYKRREFSFKPLKRSFTLPDTVNKESISARFINGVLLVNIAKFPKEEFIREVEIS